MTRLEALTKGAAVRGIVPGTPVTVVAVDWISPTAVELTYKTPDGRVANRLLYRDDEAHLELLERPAAWAFDGDGDAFRLVAEAKRIDLAYLFDPYVAVSTALVEPLPHQITAVYEEMLPRQPLRFLLADDPGAGKTIMTGLYIRELLIRADLHRCLIVAPGNLVDLWQEELDEKLRLPFDILTTDRIETSRTGNPFAEHDLLIARLDKLARDDEPGGLQDRLLAAPEWDLVVFDEAHKLSAQLVADEVKETKRRRLAVRLRERTRHLLLLTATPHTGKPEEFELFMSLLDPDRFAGHRRSKAEHPPPAPDASDLMRRVVKERLVRFDGSPLFPPRRAFVKPYRLSPPEQHLYEAVTEYVRTEMDRADRLRDAGERARGVVVGFALTVLQRRLASSPEAIYRSLRRRRERLERRLAEVERQRHAAERMPTPSAEVPPLEVELTTAADAQELLEIADDAPAAEVERLEETLVDLATAATTVAELQTEIESLRRLERLAAEVRRLGTDAKWSEFAELLQDSPEMRDAAGARRKLVVFTEHRDTLEYLVDRLATLLGRPEQIVAIHGGLARGARRAAEARFKTDPEAVVLVATDAAGEGINLQRAHLMVNYDLPWNPNRLEQRFGRIHRIGQTEPCYLWNLVAIETREGDVYATLLDKLTRAAEDLGGQVFDVLGELTFGDRPLRDLLIEAIRSGARPETWAEIERDIDAAVDRERLQRLLDERALGAEVLDTTRIQAVREAMDRANARRLQPHFIRSFFLEAFRRLGGAVVERERGRYEITHVPIRIREAARRAGLRPPVQRRYERITFEKDGIAIAGLPLAEFVCPGHPLLDATIDVLLADHTDLLGRGTILIDSDDPSEEPRVLVFLEDVIVDARSRSDGRPSVVSRRLDFVELFADGREPVKKLATEGFPTGARAATLPLMDELFDLPPTPVVDPQPAGRGRPRLQRPNRGQVVLRPIDLESLLSPDHRARLVWAFVEGLDLSPFHARIRAVEGHSGRPAIDPAILVALWLYATLEGVGSARALDRLCREHDAYRWLCGGVSVNYHTLADFRAGSADLLDDLLVQSVAALLASGEVTLTRVAHDGIRVRASAGAASFHRRSTIERHLAAAEAQVAALKAELDADPAATNRRIAAASERAARERAERARAALAALPAIEAAKRRRRTAEPSEPARASTTDPEARIMRLGDGAYRPAYNAQLTTDVGSGLVCAVGVTTSGSDQGELRPAVERLERAFGIRPAELLADGGYVTLTEVEALAACGTTLYAPPMRPRRGRDPDRPLPTDTPAVAAWRTRMGSPSGQAIYRLRAASAEWVNALARNRGLQRLVVRGIERVRAVLLWFALAHNLARTLALRAGA